ncbi:PrsW family intramembrane metalloprotease [Streptomyces sp. RKAG337]|uniref:PrsW family intramembrane metalloprotease n=1 Tax=Streptomyces sp. RKAG337 TaxID=2893404 RepID=UPI0020344CD4|nr:PrsW family intramembrane metalloprotease [Streptomyces sp. RKAG337]MCM2427685.1 PrsW family glutamic-type intramembrane protease [Streptomyces sp. RKAG337]
MSSYSHSPDSSNHPVPEYPEHAQKAPEFATVPTTPDQWHYKPRRAFWESKAVRAGALFTLLALCGVIILALVRQQIGTEGFFVGLALSILPVPVLIWAFIWLDRVEPSPWKNLVFAFAWGACAATLVAILANEYATELLATTFTASPSQTDTWGATFVAPLVEETAKGAAILLLFLFRRRHFESIVDGIVVAGLTATGFAFTENILYLGSAFGEDQAYGSSGLQSSTAATFFVRVVMTPFAHPLFTAMTGTGFAIAAMTRPGRPWRWLAPIGGWLLAMLLHGVWNSSASLAPLGFLAMYGAIMIPVFALVVWLAIWSRSKELGLIRAQLPVYAMAGWLTPPEPVALASMKARSVARSAARRAHGDAAARTVREYIAFATHLAFLRAAAARGTAGPHFVAREQELLHHLWQRKDVAQPALTHAAWATRPAVPPAWGQWQQQPYGPYPQRQYGQHYGQQPYGPQHLGPQPSGPASTGPASPGPQPFLPQPYGRQPPPYGGQNI